VRVLFLLRNIALGGVESQVLPLAARLRQRGHDATVASIFSRDPRWRWLQGDPEVKVRLLFRRSPESLPSALYQLLVGALRLRRLVVRERIDVVYAMPRAVSYFVSWIATRGVVRVRLVWGIRGSGGAQGVGATDYTVCVLTPICRMVSPSVQLAIANSQASLSHTLAEGYRFRRSVVIDNGFDLERYRPEPAAGAKLRADWGVSRSERLVGLIGRSRAIKGQGRFLEAMAQLGPGHETVRPVLVDAGRGESRVRLERLATELGLRQRLIWVEATRNVAPVYSALDLVCSASSTEGFGNVTAEAMACETPCVVTDVGASAKIVGNLGVLVPPNDTTALATGIATALARLDTPEPWRLRERMAARYGIDRLVDRTENVLLEVVGEAGDSVPPDSVID